MLQVQVWNILVDLGDNENFNYIGLKKTNCPLCTKKGSHEYGENFDIHIWNSTAATTESSVLLELQKKWLALLDVVWKMMEKCFTISYARHGTKHHIRIHMIKRFLLHIFTDMKEYLVRNAAAVKKLKKTKLLLEKLFQ